MKKNKLSVVFLGPSYFPYGMAEVQRLRLMAKGLVNARVDVTVLVNRNSYSLPVGNNLASEGCFEGINYIYTAGFTYVTQNFLKKIFLNIYGFLNEIYLLSKFKKERKINLAIIYTMSFSSVIKYRIYSGILSFPCLLNNVELHSEMRHENLGQRIPDLFFGRFTHLLVDGILPISDFLKKRIKKIAPKKKFLKIPVLVDLDRFKNISKRERSYFLFCGSLNYFEIIDFILQSFKMVKIKKKIKLYLVIHGSKKEASLLIKKIGSYKLRPRIKIFSGVSDNKLAQLYNHALALLIPLRPNLQDRARFPHKIGEYAASGRPIITTNYGEIKNYFKDGVNALVAKKYDIKEYADKLKLVVKNHQLADKIGMKGREIAENQFDYKKHGFRLKRFIEDIIKV